MSKNPSSRVSARHGMADPTRAAGQEHREPLRHDDGRRCGGPFAGRRVRHGCNTIFINEGSPLWRASNIACPSDRGAVLLMSGLV